jgi:hypothetical protein
MFNLTYRLVSILSVLLFVGCRGDINESKIISSLNSSEKLFARFQDRFPDAKTTASEIHVPMSWPSRHCYVRSQGKLASGYRLWFQQQVEIKRSGNGLEGSYHFRPSFRIDAGDDKRAELDQKQFERILDGEGVEAVLADAGIDFSLGDIGYVDLVQRVRRTVPLIEQAAGDIPDAQINITRKPYHLEGEVRLWRWLGDEFFLTATGRFRLMPNNETVELVEGVAPRIGLSDQASDPSRFIDLTAEELSTIMDSTDHVKAAEAIWRKRSH